jgi:hypothetical protein
MNASKRLRELDGTMTAEPWVVSSCPPSHYPGLADVQTVPPVEHGFPACALAADAQGIAALRNALPEIAARVEAAEKIAEGHMSSGVLPTECDWCWVDRGHDPDCPVALAVPALAALTAKLTP